jgi:hypothetical protein
MSRLINDLLNSFKPLIDKNILQVEKENNVWNVKKIEGSFDYKETKEILLSTLSTIRNHVRILNSKSYLYWLNDGSLWDELNEEIYLYDKIVQAFLQVLALHENVNLNTKMQWSYELGFILSSHRIVVDSANNLYQEINEKHVRLALLIAFLSVLVSLFRR